MNILASYNWIKEYLDTDLSAEQFAEQTTAAGNSVETSEYLAKKFDKMVVGYVKKISPHPDADKLKVATTDIGKKTVEIVCGGENLAEDQLVVVGLPGAKVRWHGEGDLIELTETKIRGVASYGMICAVEEIGFDKLPAGEKDIWDITGLTDAKPGTALVEALELDDVIFDIEVTTNRVDCKSIIGQAREGAAVTRDKFTWKPSEISAVKGTAGFSIDVKESELCPKYSAIVLDGVTVGPSPWWLQKRLLLAGFKPINNIVDITNYILHEYGQPLHTFDADKLEGEKIVVRKAKKNEKFLALDGNEYKLGADNLVIADAKKAVAVAGVMGGEETSTTEETTRVLIECATFEPVNVRRTARSLNLYSDSQLLFEKGLSVESTGPALARAVELILEVAGGTVVSDIMTEQAHVYQAPEFDFDPEAANRLMGIELSEKEMTDILERLGFAVEGNRVTVPYWRDHDIENSVDFVEEIARIHGYDKFPAVLPPGRLALAPEDLGLVWGRRMKEVLAGAGLTEAYSFAFVSKEELGQYDIELDDAIKLKNPLSMDQEYLRPSLVPSMLTAVEQNQRRFASAQLFEVAPVYLPKKGDRPDEPLELVIAHYGKDGAELFGEAKGSLERMLRELGLSEWSYERDVDDARFHAGRSASIRVDSETVGVIGQVSPTTAKAFGIDVSVVIATVQVQKLLEKFSVTKSFTPLAQFPAVKRDLAFVVDERVEYVSIVEKLKSDSELVESIELFDVYRGKGVDEGKKSIALHMSFQASDRTLEAKEVDHELEEMRTVLQKDFDAIMRS